MGESSRARGADIVLSIVVRATHPARNYSPYTFNNPSLAQVGIQQPLNRQCSITSTSFAA